MQKKQVVRKFNLQICKNKQISIASLKYMFSGSYASNS